MLAMVAMLLAASQPPQSPIGTTMVASAGPLQTVPDSQGVYPDSRFRLPMPAREQMDGEGQAAYDQALAIAGNAGRGHSGAGTGLHGPSGILLYSPHLAKLSMDTNYYLRFQSGLDDRMREVAILTVAREADNDFEWTQHAAIAKRVGIDDGMLALLGQRKPVTSMSDQDATVVELAREAVTDHHVSRQTYDRALKMLGPKKLVDLTNIIGSYLANAVMLTAFEMTLAEDQPSTLPARSGR